MTDERGTYKREPHAGEDPNTPLPIMPNTITGGGTIITPLPAIDEDGVSDAERSADQTADPVKERSHDLKPGEDFKERSTHNWSGEALVSEIQRETGVGGGTLTRSRGGKLVAGGGATVEVGGDECILYDAPGAASELLGPVENDTHLVLLDGPQKADGEKWWNVQLPDGRTGWLSETFLGSDPFVKEN